MEIAALIGDLSQDPFNPELNFATALEYERLNQTASAVSFFLRTVEYGNEADNAEIIYISLLKLAHCLADQNDREHSVTNAYLQALTVCPDRPEAYFLMSQYCEQKQEWQEAYTWARLGKNVIKVHGYLALTHNVKYPGEYGLDYEMAVSSWYIGRQVESITLFEVLEKSEIAPEYKASVKSNLKFIRG